MPVGGINNPGQSWQTYGSGTPAGGGQTIVGWSPMGAPIMGPAKALNTYRPEFGKEMTDADYQTAIRGRTSTNTQAAQQALMGAGPNSSARLDAQGNVEYNLSPAFNPNQEQEKLNIQGAYESKGRQETGQIQRELQAQVQAATSALAQQQAAAEQALLSRRAGLSSSTFNERLKALTALPGFAPGGDGVDGETSPGLGPSEQTARDAAFAREKDRIGLLSRSALTGLTNTLSERGLLGGGYEGAGITGVMANAQGQLGDVAREQTLQDLDRARQVADRNYSGGLTRRGQDISYRQALLSLINAGSY